jgi:chemotaxis family two-component system sensor kinase Cph1
VSSAAPPPVTLDNCDREPIHIPGHVQPHGALVAIAGGGVLAYASANAASLLGEPLPPLGQVLPPEALGAGAVLRAAGEALGQSQRSHTIEQIRLPGGAFELIVHRVGDLAVAEFEPRPTTGDEAALFAFHAHRGMDRLRRQTTVQSLLEAAVEELRALTGFDRVMAYRFRHDASGDVVAESVHASLDPFLHRRYPASDIPAQARRLYVINTLRLIADVNAVPSPVTGRTAEPLDMSHSVLRSVSPVHIEYLRNLGVGASMSVSIVIGGQLWGMLACHHMGPRHVPYAVRMACDVLAQVLAANIQSLLAVEHAQAADAAARLRSRLVEGLLHAEDSLGPLAALAPELMEGFQAHALVVGEAGKIRVQGEVGLAAAQALLEWLESPGVPLDGQLLALDAQSALPAELADRLAGLCGVLALQYDTSVGGWLVLLRKEQIETIAWGGRPEKEVRPGPLGPRLTPRGSFEVWKQTVRGRAEPWTAAQLAAARLMLGELSRAAAARSAEMNRAKNQLMAVLGHDLRNPLQTISMAAHVLERGADGVVMGQRIRSSSSRMQRLISQVLDMSRLQGGLGLAVDRRTMDVAKLVGEVIDEAELAHPDMRFERELPAALQAQADADRLSQLLGNLLSNARHHGAPGEAVRVRLAREAGEVVLAVGNVAPPIPAELVPTLFSPYKAQSAGNRRNPGGLGLGLYIAREIAAGHGGNLAYGHTGSEVVFTLRFAADP